MATISFNGSEVVRTLYASLNPNHWLFTDIATQLVKGGLVVPYTFIDDLKIVSPRVPFVSYPHEWCDAQLCAAGELTLSISEQIATKKFELKDASAWNVIFDGTHPVFCDHLSFEVIQSKHWWAFGQFVRHFVLPLELSRKKKLATRDIFKIWRDGIPAPEAYRILGLSRFASRCLPLLMLPSTNNSIQTETATPFDKLRGTTYHESLYVFGRFAMGAGDNGNQSHWGAYTENRDHYTEVSLGNKRAIVHEWIKRIAPKWTLDLGCNTGEFSEIALKVGSSVVCIDQDPICIEKIFIKHLGNKKIFPLVINLDDMPGSRGWGKDEFAGLFERLNGSFDVALMLALLHHLAISAAIPLLSIARLAAQMTRQWLIVELIESDDQMIRHLCSQHRRDPSEFTITAQLSAFITAGFVVEERVNLSESPRSLFLLRLGTQA